MASAEPKMLSSLSLEFVERLWSDYRRDPASVPEDWRAYFQQMDGHAGGNGATRLGPAFTPRSVFNPPLAPPAAAPEARGATSAAAEAASLQDRVDQLIRSYRARGHIVAQVDPLGVRLPEPPELDPVFYRLTEADMDRPFSAATLGGDHQQQTLRQIIQRLRNTYCRYIGVQFMHIDDLAVRQWLQERMEGTQNRLELTRRQQMRILSLLTDAVTFEEFIQRKFVGAKSFSLEGAESLIPLLDLAFEKAGAQGIDEIVMGMAHRGRLNVLANILGKSPQLIFREFEDSVPERYRGRGDVKYHLGYSSTWRTASGKEMHLSLSFNPSHLEYINPVVLGRLRAKQDRVNDTARRRGLALLIHGDAGFIGEGVVQESLNLSQLEGYRVGGALHVVVNNQLGFTTSPREGRSTTYATDVAKMLQSPIFHVNGEDPEAVAQVINLAMDFREHFQRDVVIDMYCYRKRGHNEGDEPSFTQPVMYRAIEGRTPVRESYLQHLVSSGGITREVAEGIASQRHDQLEQELSAARREDGVLANPQANLAWSTYVGGPESAAPDVDTGVPRATLVTLLEALTRVPEGFHLHPKLERFMRSRREMSAGKRPLDWSAGEALALASLTAQGHPIRISGQDTPRGTFSQRHAVLHDHQHGHTYESFAHVAPNQARVEIINSPLSEAGVLGFEYGYSLEYPEALVGWEAQFGDFINSAQVIIDQFLASAEDKWKRLSGVVLLLPHGFEGQGPEHSSARLERFLVLAAEENIQVVYPTTAAQYFHVLRRQVVRPWRKPLIVLTPKSMLRLAEAGSSLDECAAGSFQRVIGDAEAAGRAGEIRRVLLCSGKVYWDLVRKRQEMKRGDVAIVRIEQLYPLAMDLLGAALSPYGEGTEAVFVQEEPRNMGAWRFLHEHLGERVLGRWPLRGISRPESASPATGSHAAHKLEQDEVLGSALGGL